MERMVVGDRRADRIGVGTAAIGPALALLAWPLNCEIPVEPRGSASQVRVAADQSSGPTKHVSCGAMFDDAPSETENVVQNVALSSRWTSTEAGVSPHCDWVANPHGPRHVNAEANRKPSGVH
jgi:hypothetical protein